MLYLPQAKILPTSFFWDFFNQTSIINFRKVLHPAKVEWYKLRDGPIKAGNSMIACQIHF